MDIFFQDPSEIPLPPDELRIREVRVDPWPDGQRVRVYLEVDPFQRRPNADLKITDAEGEETAQATIIETMTRKMEITMHLRGSRPPSGEHTLSVALYYAAPEAEEGAAEATAEQATNVVDRTEVIFNVGA